VCAAAAADCGPVVAAPAYCQIYRQSHLTASDDDRAPGLAPYPCCCLCPRCHRCCCYPVLGARSCWAEHLF
jgi:hypothetical protein